MTTAVELLSRYRNQSIVDQLRQVLAGHGRDRPSARTVRSHRRKTPLTTEQTDKLIAEYRAGTSVNEIANQLGVHRSTVLNTLDRTGVERRWGKIDRHIEEAQTLYESGFSMKTVGEHFGVSMDAVRTAFLKHGVPIRPRNGWKG